jgi:hypothetical protein
VVETCGLLLSDRSPDCDPVIDRGNGDDDDRALARVAATPKRWRRARAAAATIVFIVMAWIVAAADGYKDVYILI